MNVKVEFGQTRLELLPEKAVYAVDNEVLFIADAHLGKDATFRREGIPVPSMVTKETLERLDELLSMVNPQRLVVLGDLFHDRHSLCDEVRRPVEQLFRKFSDVAFQLVLGNHDAHVRLPSTWNLKVIEPVGQIARCALAHEPSKGWRTNKTQDVLLCGHIHPAISLKNAMDAVGSLPCFWERAGQLVLPAFGAFTGTFSVQTTTQDQVWAIAEKAVIPMQTKKDSEGRPAYLLP